MKKLSTLSIALLMGMSILFISSSPVEAAASSIQIVPTTKHVSKKVYRKGRWVTKTTWVHGKRVTKKVWTKSKHIGRKIVHKTHDVVMGPKNPRP